MKVKSLHHVAYRCRDAQETVDFYTKVLGVDYLMAVAENLNPTTGEDTPYMHIFFAMDDGSCIAFFELPDSPDMALDKNTPAWVQHLALNVESEEVLLAEKERIESLGIEVLGPTDHTICKSIYFFDPNGHRLELTFNTTTPEMIDRLVSVRDVMLGDWNKTKRAPAHAAWVHEKAMRTFS